MPRRIEVRSNGLVVNREFPDETTELEQIINSTPSPKKLYWTDETDAYLFKYLAEEDTDKRDRLFEDYIYTPLKKLAENCYNRFRSGNRLPEGIDDLVGFLTSILPKVDRSRGKPFAFLSISARNYVIAMSMRTKKDENLHVSFDVPHDDCEATIDDYIGSKQYRNTIQEKEVYQQLADRFLNIYHQTEPTPAMETIYQVIRGEKDIELPNTVVERAVKHLLFPEYNRVDNGPVRKLKKQLLKRERFLNLYTGSYLPPEVEEDEPLTELPDRCWYAEDGETIIRSCPGCFKHITYKPSKWRNSYLKHAVRDNKMCISCSMKQEFEGIYQDKLGKWYRECPECFARIYSSSEEDQQRNILHRYHKEGRMCRSCCNKQSVEKCNSSAE